MIYYNHLALSADILQALDKIKIEYVFQPIYEADGETVFAREALMRPIDMTVTELIDEYHKKDMLHVIEVATFFGAMQAYMLRGYTEWVSINSFPSEAISREEAEVFYEYYGDDIRSRMIIELLEYPSVSLESWKLKDESVHIMNNMIAMDDFGVGINNMDMVNFIRPDIVKMDRSLVSDIDADEKKQAECKLNVEMLHGRGIKVVAEGIERKEEFDYLVSLGVDYFQGYYLKRPE